MTTSLWVALVMLAAAGAADMWSGIFRTSIAQTVVTNEMRGGCRGSSSPCWPAVRRSATSKRAGCASLVSVPFSIVSGSLACIAGVGVLGALVPQFARYDARHPTP